MSFSFPCPPSPKSQVGRPRFQRRVRPSALRRSAQTSLSREKRLVSPSLIGSPVEWSFFSRDDDAGTCRSHPLPLRISGLPRLSIRCFPLSCSPDSDAIIGLPGAFPGRKACTSRARAGMVGVLEIKVVWHSDQLAAQRLGDWNAPPHYSEHCRAEQRTRALSPRQASLALDRNRLRPELGIRLAIHVPLCSTRRADANGAPTLLVSSSKLTTKTITTEPHWTGSRPKFCGPRLADAWRPPMLPSMPGLMTMCRKRAGQARRTHSHTTNMARVCQPSCPVSFLLRTRGLWVGRRQ